MQPNFTRVHSVRVVQVQDVETLLETEQLVELAILLRGLRSPTNLLAPTRQRWIAVLPQFIRAEFVLDQRKNLSI